MNTQHTPRRTDKLKGLAAHAFWAGSYRGRRDAWMLLAREMPLERRATCVYLARAAHFAYLNSLKHTLRIQNI